MTGIIPVSYESFSTSNQSIVPSGAWSLWSLTLVDGCDFYPRDDSDSSDYDIECDLMSPFFQTVYHPTLEANISVNLADYGGATSLDFTWTYWPVYFGSNVAAGTSIPVHSQVGDAGFDDSFPSVVRRSFDPLTAWNNTLKISHSGSTSVVRGSDPTIGYIALQINLTMSTATVPNAADDSQEISCWVKDIGINITTPVQSSTPAASTGPSSSPSSPPIGVIAGVTIGAVGFVALLVIALLLFRRQRERAKGYMADATTFITPLKDKDSLPHKGEGPTQLPWVGADSADSAQPMATPVGMVEPNDRLTTPWTGGHCINHTDGGLLSKPGRPTDLVVATTSGIEGCRQQSSGSNVVPTEIPPNTGRPLSMHSSSSSAMPDYPPPIYGLEELVQRDRTIPPSLPPEPASTGGTLPPVFSPELARFATANRDVINESLEARLQAAGYLPADDPSNLTPEQWRIEHGVTRLELRRLQDLYTRNR